jgi:hypothetical protein
MSPYPVPCVVPGPDPRALETGSEDHHYYSPEGEVADDWVADVNGMLSFNTKFLPKPTRFDAGSE